MSATTSSADLGHAIRRLRQAHRATIDDLAFAAGMHPTYLSAIERGRYNPTWEKLCGVADALHLPVSALAREAEEEAVITRVTQATRARLKGRSNVEIR